MLAVQLKRSTGCAIGLSRLMALRPARSNICQAHRRQILYRAFATTPRHRKDQPRIGTIERTLQSKTDIPESVKPETVQRAKPAASTKEDPLLAEQTVSNKEQRKADWAIIKEMTRYLWPKDNLGTRSRVALSVGLLIGAKVA